MEGNLNRNEFEELSEFCGSGNDIYIYQHHPAQMLISKYLWMAQIPI